MPSKLTLVALIALLAGCQSVPMIPGISPYKIDIQQGNYVTQDMVAKLKAGMSRSQVRFALGTPLIVDPFHSDRWDYVYVQQKGGRVLEQRRIIVLFKDDKLVRIEGDVAPIAKGAEGDAAAAMNPPAGTSPPAATPAAAPAGRSTSEPAAATEPPGATTTPLQR